MQLFFHVNCNMLLSNIFVIVFIFQNINLQVGKAHWWQSKSAAPTWNFQKRFSTPEECTRQCQDNETPKYCYFLFVLEYYTTNNYACDFCDVPVNDSRITSSCQCVISDGIEKTIFSINRMVPGPSIQVCKNDYLIIDVENKADGLEASIHWHGIFQNGYQYYDGVPYLTQCPILSANTFRCLQFDKKNIYIVALWLGGCTLAWLLACGSEIHGHAREEKGTLFTKGTRFIRNKTEHNNRMC
ncbi:uncharacterized protein [Cardiocondyla obscurior]|uniref:uncharacterized protein isoform X2 n=1 Tax=Cardiocondyla obscurior TaxID=286306 RepID=UPI0039655B6F